MLGEIRKEERRGEEVRVTVIVAMKFLQSSDRIRAEWALNYYVSRILNREWKANNKVCDELIKIFETRIDTNSIDIIVE